MRNRESLFRILGACVLFLMVQACGDKSAPPGDNVSVIWGRLGLFVTGFKSRPVSLRIAHDRKHQRASFRSVNPHLAFARVDWRPGTIYGLTITMADGSSHISRARSPLKPTPALVQTINLESAFPFLGGQQVTHTPTFVRFSPDGGLLALGTSEGYVAVFDPLSGKPVWSDRITEGRAKHAAFSPDGSILYLGEQSPDGFVYAIAIKKHTDKSTASTALGAILWKYRMADDLGASLPADANDLLAWVQFPGPFRMVTVPGGDLLVLASRSWEDAEGGHARSYLYRFNAKKGSIRWRWPTEGPCPLTTMWFDVSPDGRKIALVAHERFGGSRDALGRFRPGSIYLLDGRTGEEIAGYTIPPLRPFFNRVIFWRGVAMRPDGKYLCATSGDGRGYLFNLENIHETGFVPSFVLNLAMPFDSGGIPVLATVGTIAALQDCAVYVTGLSYIPMQSRAAAEQPPSLHPNANTCFAYDWNGRKLWQCRMDNANQGIAASLDGRFIVIPISSGPLSSNDTLTGPSATGAVLFDVTREGSGDDKYAYIYPIEGSIPYNTVDISPDGLWVAVAEAPRTTADSEKTLGRSRVYILH